MSEKKIALPAIIYSVLAIAAFLIIGAGILIYGFGVENRLIQAFGQVLPYPAAIIKNTNFVTINELGKNLESIRMFYENQDFSDTGFRVDFTTGDGQKRLMIKKKDLLNKMIENKIIEILAAERGITVTREMVNQEVDREIAQYGSKEEVLRDLEKLYGWNIDSFKEKIVKPDLYEEALQKNIQETDPDAVKARKKIDEAMDELKSKNDFAEVAKKYSESESAKNGGELGWFDADQMIPQIAVAAFMLDKGEISDVIRSPLGFHVIKVEDKKTEDGADKVAIRQILVRTEDFSEWLFNKEKNIKIYIPLKGLYWDNNEQTVKFEDNDLRQFEDNLDKNSLGDISVLF